MEIIKFLVANWDSVLVIVGFLALVAVLIKRGETKILKNILFKLVTQAEREFGSGTGTLKYAAVSDWLYQRMPAVLKFLFTEKDIDSMIESGRLPHGRRGLKCPLLCQIPDVALSPSSRRARIEMRRGCHCRSLPWSPSL